MYRDITHPNDRKWGIKCKMKRKLRCSKGLLELGFPKTQGLGFPKTQGPPLGVPITRIIVCWGPR